MTASDITRRPIVVVEAPAHPVPQLQGPFEESMFESANGQVDEVEMPLEASERRAVLLEAPTYQRVVAGRWKQRPGEKYHPLWKLIAQMSFGLHLLAESLARSEDDVFQILQTHVDDIDAFLERTTEDLKLAQEDINERLKCLMLPLQHPEVFDKMLESADFRGSIVDGNEKIEHIVVRTGCAMKDALKDVQKGFDSVTALEKYLRDLDTSWIRATAEHEAVFVAMLGNVEGWKRAFLDLHVLGNKLAGSLRKLAEVVNQMQQRAGEVSRRLVRRQQKHGQGPGEGAITNFSQAQQQQDTGRSSSRAQQTPSPIQAKKTLPGAPLKSSTKHHSHDQAHESSVGPRSGTNQSFYTANGTNVRSEASSRTASRTEHTTNGRDSIQQRTNTPRLVSVRRSAQQLRDNHSVGSLKQVRDKILPQRFSGSKPDAERNDKSSQRLQDAEKDIVSPSKPKLETGTLRKRSMGNTNSPQSQEEARRRMTRNLVPAELPADIPTSAFLQAPMSSTNRFSMELGILPSDRRAQAGSKYNPTAALIELLSDPSRYSRLPLTPTSTAMPGDALSRLEGRIGTGEFTSHQDNRTGTVSEDTPSGTQAERHSGSSLTVSGPVTRRVITPDHDRLMNEKIPIHSSSHRRPAKSLAKESPVIKLMPCSSTRSTLSAGDLSKDQPGLDGNTTDTPSELSAGYEELLESSSGRLQEDRSMLIGTPDLMSGRKSQSNLSFIAELEGSLPVLLPSTVYSPVSPRVSTPSHTPVAESGTTHATFMEESAFDSSSSVSAPSDIAWRQQDQSHDSNRAQPDDTASIQTELEDAIRFSAALVQEMEITEDANTHDKVKNSNSQPHPNVAELSAYRRSVLPKTHVEHETSRSDIETPNPVSFAYTPTLIPDASTNTTSTSAVLKASDLEETTSKPTSSPSVDRNGDQPTTAFATQYQTNRTTASAEAVDLNLKVKDDISMTPVEEADSTSNTTSSNSSFTLPIQNPSRPPPVKRKPVGSASANHYAASPRTASKAIPEFTDNQPSLPLTTADSSITPISRLPIENEASTLQDVAPPAQAIHSARTTSPPSDVQGDISLVHHDESTSLNDTHSHSALSPLSPAVQNEPNVSRDMSRSTPTMVDKGLKPLSMRSPLVQVMEPVREEQLEASDGKPVTTQRGDKADGPDDADMSRQQTSHRGVENWKAFFSKGPKSPSGSIGSAKSIRSPSIASTTTMVDVKPPVLEPIVQPISTSSTTSIEHIEDPEMASSIRQREEMAST